MMKNIPVYKHTAAYAREHDELAAYRASNQVSGYGRRRRKSFPRWRR